MRNEMPPNLNRVPFPASGLPGSKEAENLVRGFGNSRCNTAHVDTPQADFMPYPYRMTSNGIEPINHSSPTPSPQTDSSRKTIRADEKFDLTQYRSVTDIDVRIHELEKQEYNRHETRQEVLKRRQVKDAELKRKRDLEDEKWQEEEERHEKEEGELRRARKRLKRESMGMGSNSASQPVMPFLKAHERSFQRGQSPTLNSYISTSQTIKPRVAPTRRKYNKSEKWDKRHGPPEGCDKYGRFVWFRVVDGRMVTIKCIVAGCLKNEVSFKTIHGLMCHLKRDHNIEPEGREHLLMRCGTVADMGDAGTGVANDDEAVPGAGNQDDGEEEEYLDNGSACEANGGLSRDKTPFPTQANATTDPEIRSFILSHVQINPNVPIISIESSEEPQVQPQGHSQVWPLVPANPTKSANNLDQDMKDIENAHASQIAEYKERSIKEESLSGNEQSRFSSLFGGGNGGESREENEGPDEGGEGNMDIAGIVRRNTPDDEVIRKLLSGVPESAFAML